MVYSPTAHTSVAESAEIALSDLVMPGLVVFGSGSVAIDHALPFHRSMYPVACEVHSPTANASVGLTSATPSR